jgi:2-alkyl-3-oxoalkanoate reductase
MRVLVTGAGGFIGRRLVDRLLDDGARVRALLLPDEPAGFSDLVEVARGDLVEPASLAGACVGIEVVYHLAAMVGDWGPEERFEAVNVEGTRNLLAAAAAAGCRRLVMVSSIVVYGWQLATEVCHEDRPRERGCGPYSRTKRASEQLALDCHALGRLEVSVVRPGNVFGPGSLNWVRLPLEILAKGQMVLMDGGGGDAALAYVDNVADVIARAGSLPGAAGRIYNANDGGGVSWSRYFSDLAELGRLPPPRRSVPARAALAAAAALERVWRWSRRPGRPLLTREAVTLLSSRSPVPIDRAAEELGYRPPVPYPEALGRIAASLDGGAA